MAKKRTAEEDQAELEKKVKERAKGDLDPEGRQAVRMLQKRLRRAQRKIRMRSIRVAKSVGKKAAATT